MVPPFSLVILSLSPFPRTRVLKAIHVDLCEQLNPADFGAGHEPGARRGKRELGWRRCDRDFNTV